MINKNIGFHTRLVSDNTVKVCGGSFGGSVDIETVNRLVKSHFNVLVKPSGQPVFVDKEGREVRLYIAVDPSITTKGVEARKVWRLENKLREEAEERQREQQQDELENVIESMGLTHEEVMRRLTQS